MKSKMFAICSSVAALHLIVGGAVILGGCTGVQEDEPMPFGALVPGQDKTQEAAVVPETTPATTPETATEAETETVIVEPEKEEPVVADPIKEEPVKEEPVKVVPMKGDSPKASVKGDRKNDVEYVVQKGDSYWKIARMYGISTASLVAYNDIAPEKLRPGQKIMIPASGKKVAVKPAVKKQTVKVKKTYEPIPADGIYVVKKGDSFYKIAAKYGLTAKAIAEYNNLPLTKMLQINQKLKLPTKNATSAVTPVVPADSTTTVTTDVTPAPALDQTPAPAPAPVQDALPEVPTLDTTVVTPPPAAADTTVQQTTPPVPSAEEVKAAAMTEIVLDADTTVKDLVNSTGLSEAEIRKKNPDIPADGTIKAGTTIKY